MRPLRLRGPVQSHAAQTKTMPFGAVTAGVYWPTAMDSTLTSYIPSALAVPTTSLFPQADPGSSGTGQELWAEGKPGLERLELPLGGHCPPLSWRLELRPGRGESC